MEAEEDNHLACPFSEWLAINNHNDSVPTAVDMLLKLRIEDHIFSSLALSSTSAISTLRLLLG